MKINLFSNIGSKIVTLGIFDNVWNTLWNMGMKVFYGLYFGLVKAIAWSLDMLTQLFFIFAGMTPIGTNTTASADDGIDIVNFFLTQKSFQKAYLYLCLIALGLIVVFAIGKIIKQDYFDRSGPRSKAPIFRNIALSFIAFICIIPVFYFMIDAVGALALLVMKALGYKGGGLGTILFNMCWEDGGESIRSVAMALRNHSQQPAFEWNIVISNIPTKFGSFDISSAGELYFPADIKPSKVYDPDNFGWYSSDTFYVAFWNSETSQSTNFPIQFYWWMFLLTGPILIVNLGQMMLSMVTRLFKLVSLFIVAPSPIAQIVLDDGQKFKAWKDQVVQEALRVVGCVMSFMIFMMMASFVPQIDLMKFAYTSDSASASLLGSGDMTTELSNSISALYYYGDNISWVDRAINSLGRCMLLIAGVGAIKDIDATITPLISGGKTSFDDEKSGINKALTTASQTAVKGAFELGGRAVGFATNAVSRITGIPGSLAQRMRNRNGNGPGGSGNGGPGGGGTPSPSGGSHGGPGGGGTPPPGGGGTSSPGGGGTSSPSGGSHGGPGGGGTPSPSGGSHGGPGGGGTLPPGGGGNGGQTPPLGAPTNPEEEATPQPVEPYNNSGADEGAASQPIEPPVGTPEGSNNNSETNNDGGTPSNSSASDKPSREQAKADMEKAKQDLEEAKKRDARKNEILDDIVKTERSNSLSESEREAKLDELEKQFNEVDKSGLSLHDAENAYNKSRDAYDSLDQNSTTREKVEAARTGGPRVAEGYAGDGIAPSRSSSMGGAGPVSERTPNSGGVQSMSSVTQTRSRRAPGTNRVATGNSKRKYGLGKSIIGTGLSMANIMAKTAATMVGMGDIYRAAEDGFNKGYSGSNPEVKQTAGAGNPGNYRDNGTANSNEGNHRSKPTEKQKKNNKKSGKSELNTLGAAADVVNNPIRNSKFGRRANKENRGNLASRIVEEADSAHVIEGNADIANKLKSSSKDELRNRIQEQENSAHVIEGNADIVNKLKSSSKDELRNRIQEQENSARVIGAKSVEQNTGNAFETDKNENNKPNFFQRMKQQRTIKESNIDEISRGVNVIANKDASYEEVSNGATVVNDKAKEAISVAEAVYAQQGSPAGSQLKRIVDADATKPLAQTAAGVSINSATAQAHAEAVQQYVNNSNGPGRVQKFESMVHDFKQNKGDAVSQIASMQGIQALNAKMKNEYTKAMSDKTLSESEKNKIHFQYAEKGQQLDNAYRYITGDTSVDKSAYDSIKQQVESTKEYKNASKKMNRNVNDYKAHKLRQADEEYQKDMVERANAGVKNANDRSSDFNNFMEDKMKDMSTLDKTSYHQNRFEESKKNFEEACKTNDKSKIDIARADMQTSGETLSAAVSDLRKEMDNVSSGNSGAKEEKIEPDHRELNAKYTKEEIDVSIGQQGIAKGMNMMSNNSSETIDVEMGADMVSTGAEEVIDMADSIHLSKGARSGSQLERRVDVLPLAKSAGEINENVRNAQIHANEVATYVNNNVGVNNLKRLGVVATKFNGKKNNEEAIKMVANMSGIQALAARLNSRNDISEQDKINAGRQLDNAYRYVTGDTSVSKASFTVLEDVIAGTEAYTKVIDDANAKKKKSGQYDAQTLQGADERYKKDMVKRANAAKQYTTDQQNEFKNMIDGKMQEMSSRDKVEYNQKKFDYEREMYRSAVNSGKQAKIDSVKSGMEQSGEDLRSAIAELRKKMTEELKKKND